MNWDAIGEWFIVIFGIILPFIAALLLAIVVVYSIITTYFV